MKKTFFYLFTCVFMFACVSNPGVINISPDTYLISRTDASGIFGSPAAFKAKVFEEARKFAAVQGKYIIPLTVDEVPMKAGQFYSIDLQFRVVSQDDPEYKRVTMLPRPDFVSESKSVVDVNIKDTSLDSPEQSESTLYDKLIRLDDLKTRGILTEKEFQARKEKLLQQ
ncbi:MAG: hypothetical protein ACJA2O_003997 [Candidatus Azotimanducaceae bacterium]|jgi:hypothetical protein